MEVRVLGPIELFDGTSTVALARSERTLLAALAARVGERVPAETLEEALWPVDRPPSAHKTLQGKILRLRRSAGTTAIVELDGAYRLDPNVVAVDARRVAMLAHEARDALRRHDHASAAALLTDARDAFRGLPYEAVDEAALPPGEVQRLVELRNTIFEDSVETDLALGEGGSWIGELETFLQNNPYREQAWGLLMRSLYQAGRPADALAAFGRARLLLASELGIEPGPALRAIERDILGHDSKLLRDEPGTRRLGPANLVAAVAPLVGRQLELAVLAPLLDTERLITLTGVGGIGKTRLALELSTQSVGRTRCGPYFVDLAAVGDGPLVPVAVAAALGVAVEPTQDPMAEVTIALAGEDVVILFDNCEHLLPEVATAIGGLLTSNAGVRVVATSREALGIAGERVFPVDPLAVPAAGAAEEEIERSDAAVLFLARLPINVATGPLGPAEFAAVARVCRTLDGIPLGLELAAARCRTTPLSLLADRLDRSIDELAPARHGVVARHRTMRAALDWGFALLSPAAQAALRAMSVFVGGYDLAAFSAICVGDDPRAEDVLDELVRTSFVTVSFLPDRTRYRLLEPVRQYALGLLDASGEGPAQRRRHLSYFLVVACTLTEGIDQVGVDTKWDDVRAELGNLRAALDWAAADVQSTEPGLRLAARLWDVWASDGHHDEGLTRLVALLESGAGSPAARAEAAYAAGFIAANVIGDDVRGIALWEQSLADALSGEDRRGEVRARRVLSTCAMVRADVTGARQHLETAIVAASDVDDPRLTAYCELALAELLAWVGDLDGAAERVAAVLAGPAAGVPSVACFGHLVRVPIMVDRGDYATARQSGETVVELGTVHSMLHFTIEAHLALAEVDIACGDAAQAAVHLASAGDLSPGTAAGWEPWFVKIEAEIALAEGRLADARRLADTAVRASVDVGAANECSPLGLLGRVQLAGGEAALALATFERLVEVASAAPFPCRQADGHEGAAAAAALLGRPDRARRDLDVAGELRARTHSTPIPRPMIDRHLLRFVTAEPGP